MLALLDPTLVPAVVLGLSVPLTCLVVWRERKALDLRRVGWAVFGRVPGTVVGVMAVVYLSDRWLSGAIQRANPDVLAKIEKLTKDVEEIKKAANSK